MNLWSGELLHDPLAAELEFARRYPRPLDRPCSVAIYGAGNGGRQFLDHLATQPDIHAVCFMDDDPARQGTTLRGIPVVCPSRLARFPHDAIVIALAQWQNAAQRLEALGIDRFFSSHDFTTHLVPTTMPAPMGFHHFDLQRYENARSKIQALHQLLADDHSRDTLQSILQYRLTRKPFQLLRAPYPEYQHPQVQAVPGDIIFDCGGFDGDTALLFSQTMNEQGHIHIFEPSPHNLPRLQETLRKSGLASFAMPWPLAVGDQETTMRFLDIPDSPVSSRLSSSGGIEVQVARLDHFCVGHSLRPSFIKMDIEGFELRALHGAADTIRNCRPKLQICLYHEPEHLWQIPLYLHTLVATYRFYLGQHATGDWTDTVLYATP